MITHKKDCCLFGSLLTQTHQLVKLLVIRCGKFNFLGSKQSPIKYKDVYKSKNSNNS